MLPGNMADWRKSFISGLFRASDARYMESVLYQSWSLHFHVCPDVFPLGIRLDHVPVVVLLKLDGDHLIDVIRGDTAICGNTQYPVIIDSRA